MTSKAKNIYFASDLHLGMKPMEDSRRREQLFISWLDEIRSDASELWLLGDVFDYWYEYHKVVPRGFTRFLGALASLSDSGVEIHFIPGNHDIWIFDYLPSELGIKVHRGMTERSWAGKNFLLGHGDGLDPSDRGYRLLQSVFKSRTTQWLYARLHPNGTMAFAHWWSSKSRQKHGAMGTYLGRDNEHQVIWAGKEAHKHPDLDYFVFGHRHIPFDIGLDAGSRVICLGDWIGHNSYAVFDGKELQLRQFREALGEIIRE